MAELYDKAREAAERLNMGDFFQKHELEIFDRLERYCADNGDDVAFIAESLPPIASLIHLAGSLRNYRRAQEWIRQDLPDAEPSAVLSALILLYVTAKALDRFANDAERQAAWIHIRDRIERWLIQSSEPVAV